ncbi:hypothetical protein DSO57_1026520 [Entomophthora muscae]|uniref:Uncharacterized protein n=1 Tax=Entomophthora muscae TaxID=34485 RepID=A0ACC2SF19_9FUNG|nr:hypothetical protein DSO57_1026520 [Entomophthora muscae]
MGLPKIKGLKKQYEDDPFKPEWIACQTTPFFSQLILTEDLIEKQISEASQASSPQKVSKIAEALKDKSKGFVFEPSSAFKNNSFALNSYSRPRLASLDYVPDSSYNNFIDSLKESCKKLSSICLEKSQNQQKMLLSDYQKQFEKIQLDSKKLDVHDARKMTFPSSVIFEQQELYTDKLHQTLILLFRGLLEDECSHWETKIPSDISDYKLAQEKERSDSLKGFYKASLESLEKDYQNISLPETYKNAINAASASSFLPQSNLFPFNELGDNLDSIPADYKDLLKKEVVNMYLLHFGNNTTTSK